MRLASWKVIALGVAALSLTAGCKDEGKCQEALAKSRQAMEDGYLDMALARQWREHAGKICGAGAAMTALDKEIIDREAELSKKAEQEATKAADAGKDAIKASIAVWNSYDKLGRREKNMKALKEANSRAKKLHSDLEADYEKQVVDFNTKQYRSRLDALKK